MIQNRKGDDRSNRLAEDIESLFRELLAKLPDGSASLHETLGHKLTFVKLVPAKPNSAPISVIVPTSPDEGVTLIAGKGSFFEIPSSGGRYTKFPLIEEVRSISSAVIAGKLEEWVLLDGDEVLEGKGIIELDGPMTVRWRRLYFRPFRKTLTEHYRYEPWVA
jgi:hypothetical protein